MRLACHVFKTDDGATTCIFTFFDLPFLRRGKKAPLEMADGTPCHHALAKVHEHGEHTPVWGQHELEDAATYIEKALVAIIRTANRIPQPTYVAEPPFEDVVTFGTPPEAITFALTAVRDMEDGEKFIVLDF